LYSAPTNTINIRVGFPSEKENHPSFALAILKLMHHEIRHGVSACIHTNGAPAENPINSEIFSYHASVQEALEAAKKTPKAGRLIFEKKSQELSILIHDLDGRPVVVKLDINSKDHEIAEEQQKLEEASLFSVDLKTCYSALRQKISDINPRDILAHFVISSRNIPISLKKGPSITQQLIDFNKKSYDMFKDLAEGKLSEKQKNIITTLCQKNSISMLWRLPNHLKDTLEKGRKQGGVINIPDKIRWTPTVGDFYTSFAGNLYAFMLPNQEHNVIVAFQHWVKAHMGYIWAPGNIVLQTTEEISGFLGELEAMHPELAKGLFPELWKTVNEPIEKYLQSEEYLKSMGQSTKTATSYKK
ncbi:MAG: hypothetical protein ACNA7Y_03005, partial [Gammaproteobacteria bacterium]